MKVFIRMKNLKLFSMIILLNFASISIGSYNDNANKRATCATLASVIPCATPISLTYEAWNTHNHFELMDIRHSLFITSDKSFMAAMACLISTEYRYPKLTLFLGAHALGIVPGLLGMVFVSRKIRN